MPPSTSPIVGVALLGPQTGVFIDESGRVVFLDLIDALRPVGVATWASEFDVKALDVAGGLIAVAMGKDGFALIKTGCEGE